MALKDLSQADFGFWRKYSDDMRHCHEKEFLEKIDPAIIRALYQGYRTNKNFSQGSISREDMVTLNRIFTATNTILPNIYNQNPRKLAKAINGYPSEMGALLSSVLDHYTRVTKQKQENQEAIMNSWFFGLGWKKVGYHIATDSKVKGPEAMLSMMDKAALGVKNLLGIEPEMTQHQESPDFVRYETLVNTSEDPMNVHIDHKGTLKDYKVINHRLKRSLFDLMTYSNYENEVLLEIQDKLEVQSGTRFDLRDIELNLNEMMIEQRNGIWILVFVDEYPKPLRYDKMTHEGRMPWSPLSFTNEPGVRYPISHMRVASGVQTWIDNIANLQVETLGKMRNQTFVNKNILAPGQDKALRANKMGGIILGERAASAGDITEIASRGISNDQFNMLELFKQNLTEIMGSTEQRLTGKSKNRTLGQDKLAEVGGQIRDSGMLDRAQDWLIDQTEIEGQFIKQYSNAELHLEVTPKNFANRRNGENFEAQWVEFMTENNPLPLRHYLEGGQFEYKVNIYEALKLNNPEIRNEYLEALQILAPLQSELIRSGARVRLEEIAIKIGDTFEHIDGNDLIEILDSQQQAAFQAAEALKARGGAVPQELGGAQVEQEQIPGGAA